nr:carboxylesterase family protein [Microbacterium sp. Se63.02b]
MDDRQPSLFEPDDASRPLADRLRPHSLSDVVGQGHLLSADAPIGRMVDAQRLVSMVLWGPPGCGKTTIARLLAAQTELAFEPLSATFSGVADLRKVFQAAKQRREIGQGTLLFVDEIHRFNRAQQDSFLPYVEDGTIVLVGATTENPSFELNGALLSRCQVFVLRRLDETALETLIGRAEDLIGAPLPLDDDDARRSLIAMADGDGRYLLNMIEQIQHLPAPVDTTALAAAVQRRAPLYDKSQEGHYNLISALHKSMRGSDPDAALYWLARMLAGGEDPLFIARRITRFANEDIGMADPQAIQQALAAWDVYERLGSPEGELAIAQAVLYLSTAPKSIGVYRGFSRASAAAKRTGSLTPPAHILNAPTRLMKNLGYGKGYRYDPDTETGFSGADYFPDDMDRETFYEPTDAGYERAIGERLRHWARLRAEISDGTDDSPRPPTPDLPDEDSLMTDIPSTLSDEHPVRSWLGIPFATAARFRSPSLLPFDPDLPYDRKGPAPLQAGDTSWLEADAGFSEDCLNLNVWAPEDAGAEPLPVVVYIFGGGWMLGANTQTTSNASGLAATGRAIGVSVNYRLGAFGALSSRSTAAPSRRPRTSGCRTSSLPFDGCRRTSPASEETPPASP